MVSFDDVVSSLLLVWFTGHDDFLVHWTHFYSKGIFLADFLVLQLLKVDGLREGTTTFLGIGGHCESN